MNISSILSLGSVGLGLFGTFSERNMHKSRQSDFEYQAAINKQFGQFNAEMTEESSKEAIKGIAYETKAIISKQKTMFAARGITFEGSPMMIMGDTATMGSKKAQETYFNAQVTKTNYQYKSLMSSMSAESHAEEAKYGAIASTIRGYKQFMGVGKIINSESSTGSSSNVNIFDFWK